MSAPPLDEDGFHSIAWDDAPARPSPLFGHSKLPSEGSEPDGFEAVSPPATGVESMASSSHTVHEDRATLPSMDKGKGKSVLRSSQAAEVDPSAWGGRWMRIEVRDPVKEHEGSKDMYVSYAVRTTVSVWSCLVTGRS